MRLPFAQSGILRIHDVEELVDLAKAFIHLPLLKGENIGVVTYTGGWGAMAADLCDEFWSFGCKAIRNNTPEA